MLQNFVKDARHSARKTLVLLFAFCAVSGAPHTWAGRAEPTKPDLHGVLRADLQSIAMKELEDRRSLIARIQTREQVDGRQVEIRKLLLKSIGGLPDVRSPLNIRHMGTLDRGDYRVEKIIYESLPKFYVTANLYVPQAGKPPYPAVLQPTGHSLAAKARAFYQNLALGLVKQGYVVVTYDPIGQGERRLFYDPSLEDSKVGGIDVLKQKGVLFDGKCIAFAKGVTGVDLLHTTVVDDRISGVILEGNVVSYAAIATQPLHKRIFDAVLPGVLGKYYLPDLVASVAPLPLRISNLRSPLDNVIFLEDALKAYRYALAGYRAVGASRNFQMGLRREDEPLVSAYSELR